MAIALGIVLSIGAVYLIDNYLGLSTRRKPIIPPPAADLPIPRFEKRIFPNGSKDEN
jgi:hypothetical protein